MHAHRALSADTRRGVLLDLYAHACAAVDGRRTVRAALVGLHVEEPVHLIAVGKAASAMTLGALDVLAERIVRGIVITRRGHGDRALADCPALRCLEGDHPVPGPASLAAGEALLEFATATPPASRVIVLVSGGASSLAESLPPGVSGGELARLTEWGLGAGIPIDELNAVRRRLSRLKDGRLARALAHTRAEALLISDVAGDDPAVIGSGLVAARPAATLPEALPEWIASLLARAELALPPGARIPARVVATLGDALAAAERAADGHGLATRRLAPAAAGDARAAAARFAHELAVTTAEVLLWGGETTVRLPERPGRGGRSQHFALAAAELIAGHADLVILAAGTDGTDGNTADAGAIVDGGTLARGAALKLDVAAALLAADAGTFLEATGDLVHTGPTGTNVGDLMFGLRRAPDPADDAAPAEAV